jgi:hypothetical protein
MQHNYISIERSPCHPNHCAKTYRTQSKNARRSLHPPPLRQQLLWKDTETFDFSPKNLQGDLRGIIHLYQRKATEPCHQLFTCSAVPCRGQAPKWCARPLILSRYPFPALVSYADRTATPVGLKRDTHISDSSEILDRRARKCIVSIKHQESSWIWSLFLLRLPSSICT